MEASEMISKYKSFEPKIIPSSALTKLGLSSVLDVPIQPESFSQLNYCYNNVQKHLENNAGTMVFGGITSVWGNLVLRLTAHVVVQKPDGKLVCVSPSALNAKKVKFIPDPEISVLIKNGRMPIKHMAIKEHELVQQVLDIEAEFEALHLSGAGAMTAQVANEFDFRRALAYSKLEKLAQEVTSKNDQCFCGSTKQRKKCCK
ncbi:hypothetical protein PUT72_09020 [Vibrio alginolyticus]|nr:MULTISPECIES: hypothetical protein [Vibrio]ELB2831235.1 hypothetical protein [Vibrio alginolyticus]EMC2463283.1 hypothetical protein [Vibrio alginolyticus]MDW1907445.1 hypothetical protein [Vibrio sp. 705]ULF95055.1 hypothetical protein K6806_08980 [Vibrio alginolyticus]WDG12345.1 hypothetical protein PUT72_09020 [Vibrio alginolyticus]